MIASIRNWWDGREPRERLLLSVLAGLVGLFVLIFLLVLPIQSARADAQIALDRAKQELALVSRVTPSQGPATPGAQIPFDRTVLISTAQSRSIKLTRVQPADDGAFAVWIDDAQTDNLFGLFDDLLGDYAATLDRAVISADANGRLSAQFTVR
ncbi:type II secretion system protein GspM [Algimonas porphyrae]|uniref:Type II secretion system protein M n=1 Tax=Algimonas porphyrae TaxID=1128113 RepID=A0ABQ5V4L3_9PROT|nr:type II secretion system protein GspM [Algimonas porphyrae]GLQ21659.1 hypothetical protein GCM10007854_26140 [Algimonas porphyrae]